MAGEAILRHVVTFGRVLREAGVEVGPGRVADALRALDAVNVTRRDDVFFTLRQTLVSRHDELELFDRAFDAWFLRGPVAMTARRTEQPPAARVVREARAASTGQAEAEGTSEVGASAHELLRVKDFAAMTP